MEAFDVAARRCDRSLCSGALVAAFRSADDDTERVAAARAFKEQLCTFWRYPYTGRVFEDVGDSFDRHLSTFLYSIGKGGSFYSDSEYGYDQESSSASARNAALEAIVSVCDVKKNHNRKTEIPERWCRWALVILKRDDDGGNRQLASTLLTSLDATFLQYDKDTQRDVLGQAMRDPAPEVRCALGRLISRHWSEAVSGLASDCFSAAKWHDDDCSDVLKSEEVYTILSESLAEGEKPDAVGWALSQFSAAKAAADIGRRLQRPDGSEDRRMAEALTAMKTPEAARELVRFVSSHSVDECRYSGSRHGLCWMGEAAVEPLVHALQLATRGSNEDEALREVAKELYRTDHDLYCQLLNRLRESWPTFDF